MSFSLPIVLAEHGWIPEPLIRMGIRRLSHDRDASLPPKNGADLESYIEDFIKAMAESPVAVLTEKANEQHYELPSEFLNLSWGASVNTVAVSGRLIPKVSMRQRNRAFARLQNMPISRMASRFLNWVVAGDPSHSGWPDIIQKAPYSVSQTRIANVNPSWQEPRPRVWIILRS